MCQRQWQFLIVINMSVIGTSKGNKCVIHLINCWKSYTMWFQANQQWQKMVTQCGQLKWQTEQALLTCLFGMRRVISCRLVTYVESPKGIRALLFVQMKVQTFSIGWHCRQFALYCQCWLDQSLLVAVFFVMLNLRFKFSVLLMARLGVTAKSLLFHWCLCHCFVWG